MSSIPTTFPRLIGRSAKARAFRRRTRGVPLWIVILLASTTTACGGSSVPGVYFPRLGPFESVPAAQASGVIVAEGGCIWLAQPASGSRHLVLWPAGASLATDETGLVIRSDGITVRPGDRVELDGGEYTDQAWVRKQVGEIPAACQSEAYLFTPESAPGDS